MFYSNGDYEDQISKRNAAIIRGCYGLTNIPYFSDANHMIAWWIKGSTTYYPTNMPGKKSSDAWTWREPTQYCRKIDFDGYNHNAGPIVQSGHPGNYQRVPYFGAVRLHRNIAADPSCICVPDLCKSGVWLPYGSQMHSASSSPTSLRLGFCITYGNKSMLLFRDRLGGAETSDGIDFEFRASDFKKYYLTTGYYDTFMFLGNMPNLTPNVLMQPGAGTFYPLPSVDRLDMRITTDPNDTLEITLGYVGSNVEWSIKNIDEGAYFYIKSRLWAALGDGSVSGYDFPTVPEWTLLSYNERRNGMSYFPTNPGEYDRLIMEVNIYESQGDKEYVTIRKEVRI